MANHFVLGPCACLVGLTGIEQQRGRSHSNQHRDCEEIRDACGHHKRMLHGFKKPPFSLLQPSHRPIYRPACPITAQCILPDTAQTGFRVFWRFILSLIQVIDLQVGTPNSEPFSSSMTIGPRSTANRCGERNYIINQPAARPKATGIVGPGSNWKAVGSPGPQLKPDQPQLLLAAAECTTPLEQAKDT